MKTLQSGARRCGFRPRGSQPNAPAGPWPAVACLLTLVSVLAGPPGFSAIPVPVPITATWTKSSLASVVAQLSELAGQPIVLDRRIDPETPMTLECHKESLDGVLARLAAQAGGTTAILRESIRIVPLADPKQAEGLVQDATIYWRAEAAREKEIARLSPLAKKKLASKADWTWHDGAKPRELLSAAASEAGVTLVGLDRLPHDHMRGISLPSMTLAGRFDSVLADYGSRLQWTFEKKTGEIFGTAVAIEEGLAPLSASGPQPKALRPIPPPPPRGQAGRETFTLQVEAPLEELLAVVAQKLQVPLDLDRDSLKARGIAPREIVRMTVKDASREALLAAILKPLSLEWELSAKKLRVFAPPSDAEQ